MSIERIAQELIEKVESHIDEIDQNIEDAIHKLELITVESLAFDLDPQTEYLPLEDHEGIAYDLADYRKELDKELTHKNLLVKFLKKVQGDDEYRRQVDEHLAAI